MTKLFDYEHVDNAMTQSSSESIQEDNVLDTTEQQETFVFHEISEEEARLNAAEQKIEKTCQSFAEALDSVYPWLTKELLDIYEKLEEILWEKDKYL